MKLRGQRILLDLPEIPDTKLILDEKIKREVAEEYYRNADKLDVYMVGDLVEDIKKGDKVFVPSRELQQSILVEIKGKQMAMINSLSVAIIW